MNGNLTVATSNPHGVLAGYKLHDNFSLTINDVRLSDSSTSYHCSVTIDDPQISGADNIVYDQLGSITVEVYGKSLLNVPMPYRHVLSICNNILLIIFVCCLHVACCDMLYSSSKYCNFSGIKSDCSCKRQPTKHHFHL